MGDQAGSGSGGARGPTPVLGPVPQAAWSSPTDLPVLSCSHLTTRGTLTRARWATCLSMTLSVSLPGIPELAPTNPGLLWTVQGPGLHMGAEGGVAASWKWQRKS